MSQDDPRVPPPELWEGPGYAASTLLGLRLLLIATPIPGGDKATARIGQGLEARLTADYISGKLKHLAFTATARVVLGRPAERADCEEFWRQVAFSNASSGFADLLHHTAPDAVLVLGADTWSHLPPEGPSPFGELVPRAATTEPTDGRPTRLYPHLSGWAVASCIPHPATPGFEFRAHTSVVAALFGQAERLRSEQSKKAGAASRVDLA